MIIIIGAGVSGCQAAITLRKLLPKEEIKVIDEKTEIGYSPCSLPYLINNEFDLNDIWPITKKLLETQNIDLELNQVVVEIDPKLKRIKSIDKYSGAVKEHEYDYLIISTGAKPIHLEITGLNDFTKIGTPGDVIKLKGILKNIESVCVIGGGFIGCEVAFSLRYMGKKVVLIEKKEHLLPNILDKDMAKIVENYLKNEGIDLYFSEIKEIGNEILLSDGRKIDKPDHFIVCVGMAPNTDLAKKAGIKIDKGIIVDEYMRTSRKDIYAIGDCIEVKNFIIGGRVCSILANNAIREAMIASYHIASKKKKIKPIRFNGILPASISKIGKLFVAGVGLTQEAALSNGLEVISQKIKTTILPKEYKKGVSEIYIKLVADKKGKLLGGQIIGMGGVLTRANMLSFALQHGMTVKDLAFSETAYNPVCTTVIDPLSKAAIALMRKIEKWRSQ